MQISELAFLRESIDDLSITIKQLCGSNISFLELMLSTFLGFISAISVEALWHFIRQQKEKTELSAALDQELKELLGQLQCLNDDSVYVRPYSIPVWRSACASGAISNLYKDKKYTDYVETYSFIEEANCIEMEYFAKMAEDIPPERKQTLLQLLKECRNKVRQKVQTVISK